MLQEEAAVVTLTRTCEGQVLFSTALPQPQRAQKLHMYGLYADACDVG